MVDTILFPSDFFHVDKVDEDLQMEYDAVISGGLLQVVIFGYNEWFNEGKLLIKNTPIERKNAVYRGWMMKPKQYEMFYEQLLEKNIKLVTEPEAYELMHIFPNVYEFVKEDTAKMQIYPLHEKMDVEVLKAAFHAFLIKDYVKSVKGTEFPKYFDQNVTQAEFDQWMEVFYKYRGNLLTGGICVKEFLPLKYYGSKTNEYRVFYINHEPATVSRNSGQANYVPAPPRELIDKYNHLDSPFYTVDYGELEDGSWRVLETGDGSVSGLSEGQNYLQFFRALYQCFLD